MTAPTQGQQLTPAQMAQIAALVKAQAAARQKLVDAAVAGALAPFRGFTGWWEPTRIAAAIRRALLIIEPAQRQAARQTDAYLARVLSIMSGKVVRPVGAVDVTKLRKDFTRKVIEDLIEDRVKPGWVILGDTVDGPADTVDDEVDFAIDHDKAPHVPHSDVYGRVADSYRYDVVARGLEPVKAARKANVRLEALANTDVTLAVREQYYKALKEGRTVRADGWRRVLRPELGQGGPPCGLCVVAADRVYRRGDLMPIHDLCRCEVLPILDTYDPGIVLNVDDLDRVYNAAGSTGGGKRQKGALKRIRVALAENAELGPVLVDAAQHYRGPKEVAKTRAVDPLVSAAHQLEQLEITFAALLARREAGEDVDAPYTWQSNRIAALRRQLARA